MRNKVWRKQGKSKLDIFLTWIINIAVVVCIILLIAVLIKDGAEIDDPGEPSLPPVSASDVTTAPPVSETTPESAVTTTAVTTTAENNETSIETAAVSDNTDSTVTESTDVSSIEAALADDSYNKEFFNDFLFIGDSISTGLYGYDFLNSANVYAEIGFTPLNVRTSDDNGVTVYQKLAAKKPSTVVIMLGTNGLSYLDTDTMIKDYTLFIDEIRDIVPETKVVILSIPPVTKEHEDTLPENIALIQSYNEKLLALSEEKETEFIDIYTLLADEDGYTRAEYAEIDGLHIKGPAYKAILHLLEETLKTESE